MKKRVFLIVLDSLGAGEAVDAESFGDKGAHTLRSLYETGKLSIPVLRSLGIGNVQGLGFLSAEETTKASVARLRELSAAKDTTVGHWEMAGCVSNAPFDVFEKGFPSCVIDKIEKISGRKVLCNEPYSGTAVIADYGRRSIEENALIVYTSADSVLQIAAHVDCVPLEELYRICSELRAALDESSFRIGRVIARPFATAEDGSFVRTADRRDFSIEPPEGLLPQFLKRGGFDSIAVGKIYDIFAGKEFTEYTLTHSNDEGMAALDEYLKKDFCGLCFANLVDFDSLWGHRRNAVAYAEGLNRFDAWLGGFASRMNEDDTFIITADHGCDPSFRKSTDHTREYVPYIEYSPRARVKNYGTVDGFGFVSERVLEILDVK